MRNLGYGSSANLVATLQPGDGVIPITTAQTYGVVPSGGSVSRTFALTALGECGGNITVRLHLRDGERDLGFVSGSFRVGVLMPPVTKSYSSGGVSIALPDNTTVEQTIVVPDTGVVSKVVARVRLNHTWDGDLTISLVSPDGTVVPLSTRRGSGGDNFGSGATDCTGVFTVFDDAASTAISAGSAPFAGSYKPETPLSAFAGKSMAGSWKLRITDSYSPDPGTLYCWGLDISGVEGGYVCSTCPVPFTTSDVTKALSVWAGLTSCTPAEVSRLNVETGNPALDILDAARIARKVAGLEANP